MKNIWIQLENKSHILFGTLFITCIICNKYIPELLCILDPLLFISLVLFISKGFKLQSTIKNKILFVVCIIIVILSTLCKWRN